MMRIGMLTLRQIGFVFAMFLAMIGHSWSQPKSQPQNKGSALGTQQRPTEPTPAQNFLTPEQIEQAIADGVNAAAQKYEARHPTPPPDNSSWWLIFSWLLLLAVSLLLEAYSAG